MTELQVGRVKWFDDQKGFDIIESQTGENVFVHHSVIKNSEPRRTLLKNSQVQFKITQGTNGLQEREVSVIQN
jgi:CspA family cold shock protein